MTDEEVTRALQGFGCAMPEGYTLKPLDPKGLWWAWAKGSETGFERMSPGPAVFDAWQHRQRSRDEAAVAFIRSEADRYTREAAAVRPLIDTATTAHARQLLMHEWAHAVHKGSMARTIAAYIERGDHMQPTAREP